METEIKIGKKNYRIIFDCIDPGQAMIVGTTPVASQMGSGPEFEIEKIGFYNPLSDEIEWFVEWHMSDFYRQNKRAIDIAMMCHMEECYEE